MKGLVLCMALCSTGGAAWADAAATQAVNAYRAENGRAALRYSDRLEKAALRHGQDMAAKGFFDHRGSDGSDVAVRVSRTGYKWCVVAENIAMGQRGLRDVLQGWANSPGHRRNMLSHEVQDFALVQVSKRIWVMVLAARDC